jgi:hypothetical protein
MDRIFMKLASMMLLLSGWVIVVAAIALLKTATSQGGFLVAGVAVELLGLVLAFRAHQIRRRGAER